MIVHFHMIDDKNEGVVVMKSMWCGLVMIETGNLGSGLGKNIRT
jgi:hypothetical protein